MSSRWPGLGASDYAWVLSWIADRLRESSAAALVDAIDAHQVSGMPPAAELALAASRLTVTPSDATAAEVDVTPDLELGSGSVQPPGATSDEDRSAKLMPTIYVPHALITAKVCTDDGLMVWIALALVFNSHRELVSAKQDGLLRVLGWHNEPLASAQRRLRRAIKSLEDAGGVRTQVRRNHTSGARYRVYQRLLVPRYSYSGNFEPVPADVVEHVAATIGVSGLRHWLRWAVEAGGSRYVDLCVAEAAEQWGTSVSTVKRRRRELVSAGVLSIEESASEQGAAQYRVDVLPLDSVIPRGVTDVRNPVSQMSECQVTDVRLLEDTSKTIQDSVVTSVTQETLVENSDSGLRAPASPSPTRESHHQPPHVQRARQILAQIRPIRDLDPKLRGQCRSKLAGLLKRHPHQLADTAETVAALRLRFDQPDIGEPEHCQMIFESISGMVADRKAFRSPLESMSAPVPYRRGPDQTDTRRREHQSALEAVAATYPPAPNVKDETDEAFDWFCAVAARKVNESPYGLEQTLLGVQRALSARLVHDRHHDELGAAVEWVRYHAAPLQPALSKVGF